MMRLCATAMRWMAVLAVGVGAVGVLAGCNNDEPGPPPKSNTPPKVGGNDQPAPPPGCVLLELELPKPRPEGTPKNIEPDPMIDPPPKSRAILYIPEGAKNAAKGKPVTSSDEEPIIGEISYVADGDKEAGDGSYVELGPRQQWVQIDLVSPQKIHAIALWHYHKEARIYHDVVIQVATDQDFIEGVQTVFNNDTDNSAGLGVGKDREYYDTHFGRVIDAKGVTGRYVRLYSNGNTSNDQNHYIEVEVYALPAE